ncbi:MAG: PilW family protein [Planctomycetota bacterium]|jgi:prepilin-type N-terminal cleavage/methylation domain-containing protein
MRRARNEGFTLVELMIAIALMLIVVYQLNVVFNGSRQLFSRSEALVAVFQNARNAVDLIERDLSNAVSSDQMEFFNDRTNVSLGVGVFNPGEELPELRNRFFGGQPYVYNLAMRQPPSYESRIEKHGGPYRRDQLYFRTFTSIAGTGKESLVEYRLYTGKPGERAKERPILQRRVTVIRDTAGSSGVRLQTYEWTDICYYVREFKLEAFFRDKERAYVGRFYSPREAVRGGQPPANDPRPPQLTNVGSNQEPGFMCFENGRGQLDTATGELTITDSPMRRFAPGDELYCLVSLGASQNDFKGRMTIADIVRPPGGGPVKVRFEEEALILNTVGSATVPSLDCSWRGPFMPSAIRITLRIVDEKSFETRTIQRVFQVGS